MDLRGCAQRGVDHRPLVGQFKRQTHRPSRNQDVGEDDDGVHAQNAIWLQRNFDGQFRGPADFQEIMLRANGAIFGQVTPGLTHDPYRHALDRFAAAGAQEERFLVHGLGRMGHRDQGAVSS